MDLGHSPGGPHHAEVSPSPSMWNDANFLCAADTHPVHKKENWDTLDTQIFLGGYALKESLARIQRAIIQLDVNTTKQ